MINFKYYPDDAFELYKLAVMAKKNEKDRNSLVKIERDVEDAYKLYDNYFAQNKVHELSSSTVFSPNEQELLFGMYGSNKKIVKDIRTWIDKNNKLTYLKICPYCTLNTANTTEHIMPKKTFPEYAVHAKNLLPCCSECNSKKGETIKDENGKPVFINFYYDILPTVQYLFVSISFDVNGVIDFDYMLGNKFNIKSELFELIESHYNKLRLIRRFKNRAINIYTEIENSIIVDAMEHGIDDSLQKLRKKTLMDAVEYGLNHWKVALKLALSDSQEYKNYLSNKLNERSISRVI